MDSNYIINRLKSTLFKYPTVDVLRNRLKNLDEKKRNSIVSNLKIEMYKHTNSDIQEPLVELLYKMPLAS
ncbi:hypothetical protein SAMN05443543_11213 [Flavobacterium flevense]|uniref:Uncharacterized protein n=1 Tax=Flavobacterium flevense TaxID=983 RepID=A0A4Y4B1U6_9FLAO|nr:hypothetical protein [Flavobacterium flevense]GEC73559.1 hypothetical protein FFL01_30980 [Flavobacterium flevense]SHM12103.1 hypothetical protein SAMN05443543_11213 [Flavobacterium flevense]